MTPGAPAAEDVFGQLAAMRVIPVVVLDDGALCCPSCRERNSFGSPFGSPPREPILEKGSDLMVRGRVDVDALSWHE